MSANSNPKNAGRKQTGLYKRHMEADLSTNSFPYNGAYCIYGLSSEADPDKIVYIGYTSIFLNKRYNNHLCKSKRNRTKCEQWIKGLKDAGIKLIMVLLEDNIPTKEAACQREIEYIEIYRREGKELKNITSGGSGTLGFNHTEETRWKMSVAHLSKKRRGKVEYREAA